MSQTFSRTFVLSPGSGAAASQYSHAITSDLASVADVTVASGANNMEVDVAFATSGVKAVMMAADQNLDVYTNAASGGAYTNHISLVANQERYWDTDSLSTVSSLFVGASITKFFVCNTNSVAATFSVRVLTDITP